MSADSSLSELISGYAARSEVSPFRKLVLHSQKMFEKYGKNELQKSVVLKPNYSGGTPEFIECTGLAPAIIIDIDAQMTAGDNHLPQQQLIKLDNLADALSIIRASGVIIIWLSDQTDTRAAALIENLDEAALLNQKDFLSLDRGGSDRKQLRRIAAASRYCITAIVGDNCADFDELFQYLRKPDSFTELDGMLEAGWFLSDLP